MKFRPHKSLFFKVVLILTLVATLHGLWLTYFNDFGFIWYVVIMLLLLVFLIWIYSGTGYFINGMSFFYRSGFFKGSIPISQIRKITPSENFWYVGIKIALGAKNGLIIHYNKFDEIFIAPEDRKEFISQLLKVNPSIFIES